MLIPQGYGGFPPPGYGGPPPLGPPGMPPPYGETQERRLRSEGKQYNCLVLYYEMMCVYNVYCTYI